MQANDTDESGRVRSGKARMELLSPEQRSELAKQGAQARWEAERELEKSERIYQALRIGEIKIAGRVIQCAVLDDKERTRVISRNAIFRAFGRSKRGRAVYETRVPGMPSFIDAMNLQPYVKEYIGENINQIVYRDRKDRIIAGYNALLLPQLCDVYLAARLDKGVLTKGQERLAAVAEILARSLSKIGIIALVDEATGYQDERDREALQDLLNRYIGKELAKWVKTFPQEFYKEIFRLKNWTFNPDSTKRPMLMAPITIDLVYRRLAPGVLDTLRKLSPKDGRGRRKNKLFQWLSTDVGHPALKDHLAGLTYLARSQDDWESYQRAVDRVAPRYNDTLPLPFPEPIIPDSFSSEQPLPSGQ